MNPFKLSERRHSLLIIMSAASSSSIELRKSTDEITTCELGHTGDNAETAHSHPEPADGGPAAWRILIAAIILESLFWGFPLSFGVFQNYYASLPQFANNPNIAMVGTIATGIAYLGAPAIILVMDGFPKYHRQLVWIGCKFLEHFQNV